MAVVVHVVGEYDGKQLAKAQRDLDKLKRSVGGASSAYAKAGGGVAGVAAQMDAAGERVAGVGKKMSLGITLPLAAIGAGVVKTAAQFDQTMASMQVNSGATGAKMEELRGLAMQLGADTVYSAGEAADAMLELSKGGMSTASIQGGALAATMNLAATEGIALGDAATIMTQSMNTFGVKAKDSAKVTDLLAAGAVASTAGVQDLADGMKYVGSTAASLHLPMADTVTALAALNNAGIDSTTAGTSLNRMLLGLAAPSKNAAKAFQLFGVATTDANGQVLDMEGMIAELKKKLGGLSDSDRNAALKQMFGVEGMRAANVLMKQGVKGWDDLSAEVNKAGVAQEMADARMTGWAGAMERARGSAETAGLAIGNALAPAVVLVSGKVEELANWFTNLDPHTQTAIVSVAAVAAAMGPLAWGAGKVMQGFKVMVAPIGAAAKGLKAARGGLSLMRQGFQDARVAQSAFSGPLGTLGGKLRAVKDAAASVGSKLVTGIKGAGPAVGKAASSLGSSIMGGLRSVASSTAAMGKQIGSAVASGLRAAGSAAATAGRAFLTGAANVAQMGAAALRSGAAWVVSTAQMLAAKTAQLAMATAAKIAAAGQWLLNAALTANPIGLVIAALVAIGAALVLAWKKSETFRKVVTAAWNGIKAAASAVWAALRVYLTAWLAVFTRVMSGIRAAATRVWGWIKPYITGVVSAVKAVVSRYIALWVAAFNGVRNIVGKVVGAFTAARDAVSAWGGKIRAKVEGIASSIVDKFRGIVGKMAGIGRDIVSGLWNGISGGWTWLKDKVSGLVDGLVRGIKDKLGIHSPSTVFAKIGSHVIDGLVKGLHDNKHKVRKATQKVIDQMNAAMDDARQQIGDLKQQGRDLGSQLSRGLGTFGEGVADYQTGLAESTATPDTMLANMRASVTALNDWRGSLDRAAKKGLPNDIVEELRAMGLDSSDELRALNSMTDAQLKEWVGLWRQRDRSGAAEGAKQVADDIAKVVSSVEAKFESIGANAMKGLGKGLRSQSKTVRKRLQHLMDDIVADAKKALGIHSPSTVFAGIGSNVVLGMREGMADERAGLLKDVARIALPATLPAATEPARAGTGTRSVVIAPGAVQVTVTGGPGGATPAEIRREVEASLKRLLREVMAS